MAVSLLTDDFTTWMQQEMKRQKISGKKLADKAGVGVEMIGRYKRGEAQPKLDTATALIGALGYDCQIIRPIKEGRT